MKSYYEKRYNRLQELPNEVYRLARYIVEQASSGDNTDLDRLGIGLANLVLELNDLQENK